MTCDECELPLCVGDTVVDAGEGVYCSPACARARARSWWRAVYRNARVTARDTRAEDMGWPLASPDDVARATAVRGNWGWDWGNWDDETPLWAAAGEVA